MVQICVAGVVLIDFKTCGNWGGRGWYIFIVSISISSIVSQVEKAVSPWCRLLSYWGVQFYEILERLVWRSGVVFYVIRTEVFLTMRCVPWKDPSSLPGLCVPVESG